MGGRVMLNYSTLDAVCVCEREDGEENENDGLCPVTAHSCSFSLLVKFWKAKLFSVCSTATIISLNIILSISR